MVHENDVKFIVPSKYLALTKEERDYRIKQEYIKMKSRPKSKKKKPIKNKSVLIHF